MKLIYLEWEDAMSRASWINEAEVDDWLKDGFIVQQVGWIVRETPDAITISSSVNPESGWGQLQFGNLHKIPKTWIRKRRNLTGHIK